MKKIQTIIGKDCDITQLKGVSYKDFKGHNQISKTVAKEFLKAKKKNLLENVEFAEAQNKN